MNIPSAQVIAAKWARVTPDRIEDYSNGVRNPKNDWAKETADAEERYEEGIKKAISRKAFGKGVKRTGTANQQEATIQKGIPIWPERVRMAQGAMAEGMEDVVQTLSALQLKPRYATGDPRNLERVKQVADALHQMKISRS
ncbi:hypothetical protein LCGC14_0954800 [marine sediment metagenome]|uniref:Uncharacterized protein n=1 Tax=marine sediment metagenome TaxID=412755 RepID=A0A0F9QZG8_9ZZZZ|nr:hypothetical protein [bacterium]